MRLLVVRSIPLSQETQDAWHSIGAKFLRRERNGVVPDTVANKYDTIINYGNWEAGFQYQGNIPVFNTPKSNRSICYPSALRKTLDSYLPPPNLKVPHWHKRSGSKGAGKIFHKELLGECAAVSGDVQQHIEGTEYRIISVGDKIVQATKKQGTAPNFTFEWVGVQGIAAGGFVPLLKEAIPHIPNWSRTVFGWDVIHDGNVPFIIEGNTSPGINEPTAQRIYKEIEVNLNAGT